MNESKNNILRLKIEGMRKDEVYKDIARIHKNYRINIKGEAIKEGTVCKLTIGNRTKLVSIRGLLERDDAIIQLDDYTRNELGVKRHDIVDIAFKEEGVLGEFRWAWHATDPAYRIAARLGVLSVALGAVGLACGLISLFR